MQLIGAQQGPQPVIVGDTAENFTLPDDCRVVVLRQQLAAGSIGYA